MANLKNPLFSFDARGTLSKALTFVKRRGQNIAEIKPEIIDAQSPAQLSWRHMYQKCAALWSALSAAEQADWNSLGGIRHMTGFAYWQSQCLRPNPGIYLPLQGGSMSGDIEMNKNRILELPLPVDSQEAITLAYYIANIEPLLMNEGARVYHDANQSIATSTATDLAFNSERWDNDTIHDNITNNSRLTCRTAGKYLISVCILFGAHNTGFRNVLFYINNALNIINITANAVQNATTRMSVSTIWDLGVGDFVEAQVWHNAGVPLNVESSPYYTPEFMMQRIGA